MTRAIKKIAVFASGNGTNAEKIFKYFNDVPDIEVSLLLSNNGKAPVIERAKKHDIPAIVFTRETFYETGHIAQLLNTENISLIVLAGFMWLLPEYLIKAFPGKIINIHPALLPKYGGKGMYGMHVHKAVVEAGEQESGITIHYVNEEYDAGRIIKQAKCRVSPEDSPEALAKKVQKLEHNIYPKVIEDILRK